MSMLRQMFECYWTGRRLQQYLDADPSAPLPTTDVGRLEGHLAACDRCRAAVREHRVLRLALSRWPVPTVTDPDAMDRLHDLLDDLVEGRKA